MEAERKNFVYGSDELGINGCIKNGISEEIANKIYDQMIDFAKYAFNKSHAASYAAISMQTAYLKCHYFKEFSCGLLTSTIDKPDKMAYYIKETKAHGVDILNPDFNKSQKNFSIEDEGIRYGLSAVKGVGEEIMEKCIAERENGEYTSLENILLRNPWIKTKKTIVALNHVGAFDFTGHTRKSIDESIDVLMKNIKKHRSEFNSGQLSLFGNNETFFFAPIERKETEYSQDDIWRMEKEASGMYISGHPLNQYADFLKENTTLTGEDFKTVDMEQQDDNQDFEEDSQDFGSGFFNDENIPVSRIQDKQEAAVGGIITEVKEIYTKKDSKKMAFITIEDFFGTIDCVVFPKTYAKFSNLLYKNTKVLIKGTVSIKGDSFSVLANEIIPFGDSAQQTKKTHLWIQFQSMQDYFANEDKINAMVDCFSGSDDLSVFIKDTRGVKHYGKTFLISDKSLTFCKSSFGIANVTLK